MSKKALRPKKITYTRLKNGNTEIVNSTVHVRDKEISKGRIKKEPDLPDGYRFTAFTSDKGKRNIKNFIERSYGSDREFIYPANTKFYGIVGPDRKIKAAGEVYRMNWAMSESRHLVVDPDERGAGFGKKMLEYLDHKTETPVNTLTTKNPYVERMARTLNYEKQRNAEGPSGDEIGIYIKNM
jgi:GNAT superfamily N-acetyltransferase